MTRRKDGKIGERELQIQIALAGLEDNTYMSIDQAVTALGVCRSALWTRAKGGKGSKRTVAGIDEARREGVGAMDQYVISNGKSLRHPFIREMAEKLRETRVASSSEFVPPLGPSRSHAFIVRHPHLKTMKSKAIETARIKEVTSEQVHNFNSELRRIVAEHNIRLENIFNADETGITLISFG